MAVIFIYYQHLPGVTLSALLHMHLHLLHTFLWGGFGYLDFKLIEPVSHQWCDLFYRLLHSYTRHEERVVRGERDTVLHVQNSRNYRLTVWN